MASNFDFIRLEWPVVHQECMRAEQYVCQDPRASALYARRVVEQLVDHLYLAAGLPEPYQSDLAARINAPAFRQLAGDMIVAKLNAVRKAGNTGVHGSRKAFDAQTALAVLKELHHVVHWAALRFSTGKMELSPEHRFDSSLIPDVAARPLSQAELNGLVEKFRQQDKALAAERELRERSEMERAKLEADLNELRRQIEETRRVQAPDEHDYQESDTRRLLIDMYLHEAGWALDQARDREYRVEGLPSGGGGFVDYVLWGGDGKPLAIVEAKRTGRSPEDGARQVEEYADALLAESGQDPVIYLSNGYEHRVRDRSTDAAYRRINGFHTRNELERLVQRRRRRKPLTSLPINQVVAGRPYQERAIRAVAEHFEIHHQRRALLVMATGTGKTRTVIALTDLLTRASWARTVLFLADRTSLVKQAERAFKAHLPNTTVVNLVEEKSTDGRVFVSTYPTMLNLLDAKNSDGTSMFGAGFFDLVVVDEAHRSIFNRYLAVVEHFDAHLVGLTATPKDEVDRNTYRVFQLEDGVPTDVYSLEDAVKDTWLVPPRAVDVPLKIVRTGIRYDDLSEDERAAWDETEWNDDGEIPDEVSAGEINRRLFNADTVDKVLQVLTERGHRVEGGDRIAKTIVFAANAKHAAFIKERFDISWPAIGESAKVITHNTERAQALIDDFSDAAKRPDIAISVDMLDTGIDVPEVANLVLFKPVHSKAKFWQMIGRGTRLRPNLYGPGQDKEDFYVFDVCGNFEWFRENPEESSGNTTPSLTERLFRLRLELLTALDGTLDDDAAIGTPGEDQAELHLQGLRRATATILHRRVASVPVENVLVRPHRRAVERWSQWENWRALDESTAQDAHRELAHLPSAETDTDEAAKRFDLLCLQLQLALLTGDEAVASKVRETIQQIASSLLSQTGIAPVKQQAELLESVASDSWWKGAGPTMAERTRRRLRGLMRYLPKGRTHIVYSDFEDELGHVREIETTSADVGTDMERFTEKAREYLRAHLDDVALQKVYRNRQLTPVDLQHLNALLQMSGAGSAEDIAEASEGELGLFVRRLVGLDRAAAQEALAEFLDGSHYSAGQIRFVQMIIEHLTANGVVPASALFASPFTDHGDPTQHFDDDTVVRLIGRLRQVEATAKPTEVPRGA
ncbi:DEAD/DEAH box helicase family protein [Kocuria rosea]|uniref:DEAD/DEAH box helicase family protein n=1 Tax=Kocuria rosea TaxID=1275 RepID=UPI003017E42A